MNKNEALSAISKAARIYENELCNKNVLIVYGAMLHPQYIEITFLPTNFLHLTGVVKSTNLNNIEFYNNVIDNKLTVNDFDFKDEKTELKLGVLTQTIRLKQNARMVGTYSDNSNHILLQTEKLAGTTNSCMGFIQLRNGLYVPNTVLKADIRDEVESTQRVLAIANKNISDKVYGTPDYIAKKVDYNRLVRTLEKMGTGLKLKLIDEPVNDTCNANNKTQNDTDKLNTSEIDFEELLITAEEIYNSAYIWSSRANTYEYPKAIDVMKGLAQFEKEQDTNDALAKADAIDTWLSFSSKLAGSTNATQKDIFTYNREYWELFNDCIEDLRFYVENERELNSDIHV